MTQRQRTQPERTQPERTQPERTQPERTQPQRTQPQRTQPQRTQPQRTQLRRSPWKHWLVIIGATTAGTLCATALDQYEASPRGEFDAATSGYAELREDEPVRVADVQQGRRIEEMP